MSVTGLPTEARAKSRRAKVGGEAGIRTLGTTFRSYNGLANRRLQPLGHLTVSKLLRILRVWLNSTGHRVRTVRRLPQVSVAHNIIAIEDAARLVAAQFHRGAFGDPRADHVANGRPPEVVGNAARAAGGNPGPAPRVVEAAEAIAWPARPLFVGTWWKKTCGTIMSFRR